MTLLLSPLHWRRNLAGETTQHSPKELYAVDEHPALSEILQRLVPAYLFCSQFLRRCVCNIAQAAGCALLVFKEIFKT